MSNMCTTSHTQSPPTVEVSHILETTTNIKSSTDKLVLQHFHSLIYGRSLN